MLLGIFQRYLCRFDFMSCPNTIWIPHLKSASKARGGLEAKDNHVRLRSLAIRRGAAPRRMF